MVRAEIVEETLPFEPTVLGAMWRFRWLSLAVVVVVVAAAFGYGSTRPVAYRADATFVVEDPRASALFNFGAVQRPERYVANQAAILGSTAVAERVVAAVPEFADPAEVLAGLEVQWTTSSDQILLRFTADTPERAVAGANAVAEAYRELRREAVAASFTAATTQLEESIVEVDAQLADLQARIDAELGANPARAALERQFDDALARLADLQARLTEAEGEELATVRAALDDVLQQIQTLQVISGLERNRPELAALLEEQRRTAARKAELVSRKDELDVQSRLESTGISLYAPAIDAVPVGVDLRRVIAAGVVLGVLAAAGLSYLLALRRRTFVDRTQPELVLRAPLLAEVPDFAAEKIATELPVRSHPASASAEAFRFVAAALDVGAGISAEGRRVDPAEGTRSVAFTSARLGDGKTVVAANTALAAARRRSRVLVVDADFGDQRLAGLLTGGNPPTVGLTDLVEHDQALSEVVYRVTLGDGVHLHLLARGSVPVTAPDFFRSAATRTAFETIRELYDLIIVDTPPLLQVAYTSSVLRLTDRMVAVVPHESPVSAAEELADRLDFLGVAVVGYVYNRAPLRDDVIRGVGSMKDVLGETTPAGP